MNNVTSLSHTRWECKYHVVWIPKCRRKVLFGQLRKNLGEVFHELARQKESKVLEGHLQPDHYTPGISASVHMATNLDACLQIFLDVRRPYLFMMSQERT
jgi:putative transposase